MGKGIRFEILGPLRIFAGQEKMTVEGRRLTSLLAALVLRPHETVSTESLIDMVWGDGDDAPRNARNQLQVLVSRFRRQLAAAGAENVLLYEPPGYRISESAQVDLLEFRRLRERARAAVAAGEHAQACQRYRDALDLWRGDALSGIHSNAVRRSATSLDEEYVQTCEARFEAELAAGRAGELIPDLTAVANRYPYRERLHGYLMLALHRAGRQADALALYREVHRRLGDELGIEPGQDLQVLHRTILAGDPAGPDRGGPDRPAMAAPSGSTPVVPRELPAAVPDFTGRREAIDAMDEALAERAAQPGLAIIGVVGMVGVGKTALALHWAHQVADQFPDGQLFADLRAYSGGPRPASAEVLAGMLRSLGVPPAEIPADEEQAGRLYRSTLADRRVLVVLDNAGSVDQVRPLLPGSPGCVVLVTGRDQFRGLAARDGARRVTLDVLDPDDAYLLLTRLLGKRRVEAEPDAVAALVLACGQLPLALRVAGANLAAAPESRSIASYVAELADGDRLAELTVDGDEQMSVRAAFDHSYQRLPDEARHLFRMLGLVPGPTVAPPAAAALTGLPVDRAASVMRGLATTCLVTEQAHERYTLHDLMRRYAGELVRSVETEEARQSARRSLYQWYLDRAAEAAGILYPEMAQPAIPSRPVTRHAFVSASDAQSWLEAERPNLVAAVESAAADGNHSLAWPLGAFLRGYFWHHRYPSESMRVAVSAMAAAEREATPAALAAARRSLGDAQRVQGNTREAADTLTEAAVMAQRADWVEGECDALLKLGTVRVALGELAQAKECLARALELARREGMRMTEAEVHGALAYLSWQAGDLQRAAASCRTQLMIYRKLAPDDRSSHQVARTLNNLGVIEHSLGLYEKAKERLAAALTLHRRAGRKWGEVHALIGIAEGLCDTGELLSAQALARAALSLANRMGDPRRVGVARNILGMVLLASGRAAEAVDSHRRALGIGRQLDDPHMQFFALSGLAAAHSRLGLHDTAAEHALESRDVAAKAGFRVFEGIAMTALAEARLGQGRGVEAAELAGQSVDVHRAHGYRLGEARALVVLAAALDATEPQEARRFRAAAIGLFTTMGVPVPDELAPPGSSTC